MCPIAALPRAANTHKNARGGAEISSVLSGSVGKGGLNRGPDVRAVQCLLNLNANTVQSGMKAKLVLSGLLDKATQDAILATTKDVITVKGADGKKELKETGYMMGEVDETA
jgi:hypothetical protein